MSPRPLLCLLAGLTGLASALRLAPDPGAPVELAEAHRWTPTGWFQTRAEGEVAYFDFHIPKTAGCSLARDMFRVLKKGQGFYSEETCFREEMEGMLPGDRRVAMVREPVAHVYSQFLMCKVHEWGLATVPDGDKPLLANLSTWLRHFDGGRQADNLKCYHPYNMQARAFGGCEGNGDKEPSHRLTGDESLNRALKHLDEMFHVGVVEHYQASLCLLIAKAREGEALPGFCDCKDKAAWASFKPAWVDHHQPKHSVGDLSSEELKLIRELTRMDKALYRAALRRLRRESTELERRSGTRVLCE